MKYITLQRLGLTVAAIISMLSIATLGPVSALATPATLAAASANHAAASQARLQLIINRGNSEIGRRLTTLNTLSSKIDAAAKLNTADKTLLTDEVTNEVSSLQSLKTTLDGETQAANAVTDAQSIFSEYRVYALVLPKVYLVKTADDQQVTEAKLTTLASKIQSDITADQTAGKTVTSLQAQLNDLTGKVQAAQTISSEIESAVINLQPSDYNTNHSLLSGDRDQLKTAQSDIAAAISDARSLISDLKTL